MLKRIFLAITFSLFVCSCTSDDDICLSGDATPRLNVKFKLKDGKIKSLDSLYLKVDYGQGAQTVLVRGKTDSVLVPLKVDESLFTDIYFSTTKEGTFSKVKLSYLTSTEFVSAACGIKRMYDNLDAVLEIPGEVKAVEKNQNQIVNEDKTHLFLIF